MRLRNSVRNLPTASTICRESQFFPASLTRDQSLMRAAQLLLLGIYVAPPEAEPVDGRTIPYILFVTAAAATRTVQP